ncbi:MAG: hypothetical protein WC556_09175 [Candidatus Methanoperedens sp.]
MLSIVTALILLSNRTTDTAALLARTGAGIPDDQLNIKPAIIAVIISIRIVPVVGINPTGASLFKINSELIRTRTNSEGMSSYQLVRVSC